MEDDRGNYYAQNSYKRYSDTKNYKPDYDQFYDIPRRHSAINELTAEELTFAYAQLQSRKAKETSIKEAREVPTEFHDNYKEFVKWMELTKTKAAADEVITPEVPKINEQELKKVIVLEESITSDELNVVTKTLNENEQTMETNIAVVEAVDVIADFDEFKDVVSSDDEENDDYLAVPLFITEEKELEKHNEADLKLVTTEVLIPLVSVDEPPKNVEKETVVEAKMTLSNFPLEIKASVTTLSLSNTSLDRSSSSDNITKRPVHHTKGRAPPPPPAVLVTPLSEQGDVHFVPGLYYDTTSKKHFKETEL